METWDLFYLDTIQVWKKLVVVRAARLRTLYSREQGRGAAGVNQSEGQPDAGTTRVIEFGNMPPGRGSSARMEQWERAVRCGLGVHCLVNSALRRGGGGTGRLPAVFNCS